MSTYFLIMENNVGFSSVVKLVRPMVEKRGGNPDKLDFECKVCLIYVLM